MTLSNELRARFLKYFEKKGHLILPSSPVVPLDDPTLLFNNAGMNQFKDIFLGKAKAENPRATTSQKCVRVGGKHNDLENVGHTSRHLTLFEMLGNFSFGDYFKKEAIAFAWEVSTEIFEFDPSRIWASVYEEDDEAYALWEKHLPKSQICRLGRKDNFWEMGDVGPCGPCSELLFDRGEKFGKATSPANDPEGERFLEFWNLVFMQFNRTKDKSGASIESPLPKPSIDTGAGLERLVMLKMDTKSVFETDILGALIQHTEDLSGIKYVPGSKEAPAFQVISDHIRALSFAIADGAQPSNTDRGYVLRKVLRRAVRYGRQIGLNKPFLAKLAPTLSALMGEYFQELKTASSRIEELVTLEEESFIRTLKRGGNLLKSVMDKSHSACIISGEDAFKLKDTYGFPIEEIALMAKDANLKVDMPAFENLEEKARALSKSAHTDTSQVARSSTFEKYLEKHPPCTFVGYDKTHVEANVTAIFIDDKPLSELKPEDTLEKSALIVTDKTPFYAQMGGQIGDSGILTSSMSSSHISFQISNTLSPFTGVIAHKGALKKGSLKIGDRVVLQIDEERREAIRSHHSATHLVHFALSQVLGEHVRQAGSLVNPDRLRFDFNHHKALSPEEIFLIEEKINRAIRKGGSIHTEEKLHSEIKNNTSIKQFFGDKYGEKVRVVSIGPSVELCGGTHAKELSALGLVKIIKESSIASGVRRIEAVCAAASETWIENLQKTLASLEKKLGAPLQKLEDKADALTTELSSLNKHIKMLESQKLIDQAKNLIAKAAVINGTLALVEKVDASPKELKDVVDGAFQALVEKNKSAFVALVCEEGGRCQLAIKVSEDLIRKGKSAIDLLPLAFEPLQGKGGGRADFATCGGQNPSGINAALNAIKSAIS